MKKYLTKKDSQYLFELIKKISSTILQPETLYQKKVRQRGRVYGMSIGGRSKRGIRVCEAFCAGEVYAVELDDDSEALFFTFSYTYTLKPLSFAILLIFKHSLHAS